jgi:hypothetical protein
MVYQPVGVRYVEIEGDLRRNNLLADLLEAIFVAGQNDVCPQDKPSVSVGDIISDGEGRYYKVNPAGFEDVTLAGWKCPNGHFLAGWGECPVCGAGDETLVPVFQRPNHTT